MLFRSNHNLTNSVMKSLNEIVEQQKNNIILDITADVNAVKSFALILGKENKNQPESTEILGQLIENTNFDNLFWVGTDGKGVMQDGTSIGLSDRDYVQRALQGEVVVANPIQSKVRRAIITPIAAPIYNTNNEITGAIVGSYTIHTLQDLLLPTFSGAGFTHIIDGTGELIVTSKEFEDELLLENSNIFYGLDRMKFMEGGSKETF